MKKFFKRLLVALVVLLLLLGVAAGVVYYLYQGTPDWLPAPAASPAEQAAAAKRAQDTMKSTVDWASTVQAEETRSRTGTDDPAATARPAAQRSRQISFSEQEINALFDKWDDHYRWHERYGHYMEDPAVALHDGQIIFLGTPRNLPVKTDVASLHFKPSLDAQGGLHLPLVSARAGLLPIPLGLFDDYRKQARDRLAVSLPAWQRKAAMDVDGSSNRDALLAAMGKLVLNILDDRPGEAVLFLPVRVDRGEETVPVRLTDVKVADRTLTVTVEPLTPSERKALLKRLKEPYVVPGAAGEATPGVVPATPPGAPVSS